MWKRLTGVEPGNSTLPSRYIRIKQHIIVSDEAEDEDLIRCEREIAEAYVLNRWTMIGDAMLLKGYKQYEVCENASTYYTQSDTCTGRHS